MSSSVLRFRQSWAVFSAGLLLVTGFLVGSAQADAGKSKAWPGQVDALYRITFNGFDIGTFKFEARVLGNKYVLDGDAEISALLGVINWRGLTRSVGHVGRGGPQPSNYAFNFRSHSKGGLIRMGFKKSKVTEVARLPNLPPKADDVPLQRNHLSNVLDPLSTVMAMARPSGSNPCAQSLSVFDGKQRFDLAFSYRRQERLPGSQGYGQARSVAVCGVKYSPLGGYRPTSATLSMARSNGIEVAMLPIRSASLFVPQKITIPTIAGTAVLKAVKIKIDGAGLDDRVAIAR